VNCARMLPQKRARQRRSVRSCRFFSTPHTGDNVQALAADDPEDDDLTYVQVTVPCVHRRIW
jgi:hypothetical protein